MLARAQRERWNQEWGLQQLRLWRDEMTRFKELRRINHALEHKDEKALRRALGYCILRLSTATHKQHIKTWQKLRRQIEAALGLCSL